MNFVESDWSFSEQILNSKPVSGEDTINQLNLQHEQSLADDSEKLYLPFTGNGYIGISIVSKQGLYASPLKSLNLQLKYNPIIQIYSETLKKKENIGIDFLSGSVHRIQCYQNVMLFICSTILTHKNSRRKQNNTKFVIKPVLKIDYWQIFKF